MNLQKKNKPENNRRKTIPPILKNFNHTGGLNSGETCSEKISR